MINKIINLNHNYEIKASYDYYKYKHIIIASFYKAEVVTVDFHTPMYMCSVLELPFSHIGIIEWCNSLELQY